MGLFQRLFGKLPDQPDNRLPHEKYPRLLNWHKGDDIRVKDGSHLHFFAGHAKLLGITMDGRVFLEDYESRHELSLDRVMKKCWNHSASNRHVDRRIRESKAYTQLLAEFNASVADLQKRDESRGVDLPDDCYPTVPTDLYV